MSRGTVSRVLNGGHYVSPGTLDAVNRAIKKTGYVVNHHARSLVTQRSESVAFILSEPDRAAVRRPELRRAAPRLHPGARRARHRAVRLHRRVPLGAQPGDPLPRRRARGRRAAGLHARRGPAARPAGRGGRAVRRLRRAARARIDDRLRGRRRARRRPRDGRVPAVGWAGRGSPPSPARWTPPAASGRLEGYRDVVGASFDPSLVEEGDYSQDSGERAMSALLERHPDLDAVFVASDVMALGRAGRAAPGGPPGAGGRRRRRVRRLVRRRRRPARADDHAAAVHADQQPRWCGCCSPPSAASRRPR